MPRRPFYARSWHANWAPSGWFARPASPISSCAGCPTMARRPRRWCNVVAGGGGFFRVGGRWGCGWGGGGGGVGVTARQRMAGWGGGQGVCFGGGRGGFWAGGRGVKGARSVGEGGPMSEGTERTKGTKGTKRTEVTFVKPCGFMPPHGGYRKLLSYQKAEIVYDATCNFCGRYF